MFVNFDYFDQVSEFTTGDKEYPRHGLSAFDQQGSVMGLTFKP